MLLTSEVPIERFEVYARGLDHPECCVFDREGNLWAGGEAGQVYRIGQNEATWMRSRESAAFAAVLRFPPRRNSIFASPSWELYTLNVLARWAVFADAAEWRETAGSKLPRRSIPAEIFTYRIPDNGWERTGALVRFDPRGVGTVACGGLRVRQRAGAIGRRTVYLSHRKRYEYPSIEFPCLPVYKAGRPRFMPVRWVTSLMVFAWTQREICS